MFVVVLSIVLNRYKSTFRLILKCNMRLHFILSPLFQLRLFSDPMKYFFILLFCIVPDELFAKKPKWKKKKKVQKKMEEKTDCAEGYWPVAGTCFDIDECTVDHLNNCGNHTECVNTDGSYECDCKEGFWLAFGTCFDIDECAADQFNSCDGDTECVNTPGSYRCECNEGFELLTGIWGDVCSDINECALDSLNKCKDQSVCVNTEGSYLCN